MAYYDTEGMVRSIGQIQADAMTKLWSDTRPSGDLFAIDLGGSAAGTLSPFANTLFSKAGIGSPFDYGAMAPDTSRAMTDLQSLRTIGADAAVYNNMRSQAIQKRYQEALARGDADAEGTPMVSPGGNPLNKKQPSTTPLYAGANAYNVAPMAEGVFPHAEMIRGYIPDDLKNDPELMKIIAAGAKAESGWDVNRVQNGYSMGSGRGARGLFQFDMAGMGAGIPEEQLLGPEGARLQASRIVPEYAKAYRQGLARGLSGEDLASFVAGAAEKPHGWTPGAVNWGDTAQNYRQAYSSLGQSPAAPAPSGSGAPYQVNRQSQFGLGLSKSEAEAFCGPAAALALAQFYGNNIPVETVRQFASQSGWNAARGMAGPASEVNLLHKLGVKAQSEAWSDARAQQLIAGGTPLIIDTPGHYFVADQYDPRRGYRVGTSGTDLRQGGEWLTPQQMAQIAIAGAPRTMIYA
jgi:hypothetical protein